MALQDGGDASNRFLLALAHWQEGDKVKAGSWFDRAVAWMKQHNAKDLGLHQLWTEAAERLGQAGPDANPAGSVAAKPH